MKCRGNDSLKLRVRVKYIKIDVMRKPSNGSINYDRSRECLSKKLQKV